MTTERILAQFRRAVDRMGAHEMAAIGGVSYNSIREYYLGKRELNDKILDHLGWERVTVYMEKKNDTDKTHI